MTLPARKRFWLAAFTLALTPMIFASSYVGGENPGTPTPADRILVLKSARTMTLFSGQKVLKTYLIALGGQPVGAKVKQGDHKTPEGQYTIDSKNAHSSYHLGLHVSYPNAADRERARQLGVSPGGAIMIHGLPKEFAYLGALHRRVDWTDGCIAVTDAEIEEIWSLVKVGTPIEIRP